MQKYTTLEIRKKISEYKFVHILLNDKFSKYITDVINTNFSQDEHGFIFYGGYPTSQFTLPENNNIFIAETPHCITDSDNIKKIIFHGLYLFDVMYYLDQTPSLLKKSFWFPWGGDLYDYCDNEITKRVKCRIKGLIGNKHVLKIYKKKYTIPQNYIYTDLSLQKIDPEVLCKFSIPQKHYIQIMINNSSSPSTLEVLEQLKRFKNENIRIVTILSYGDIAWNKKILAKGKYDFGEKFTPILQYIPYNNYLKFLARNDILVWNHERPQGMSTIFTSMLLGKKIFMRSENIDYLRTNGYIITPTQQIKTLTFSDFCKNEKSKVNIELTKKRFEKNYILDNWKKIFTDNNVKR